MRKYRTNSLELTGFLALEPKIFEQNAFLRLVCFYRKKREQKEPGGYFIDVSCFSKGMNYKKGDKVHIKGKITSYKDKQTGFSKLAIVASRIWKIDQQKQPILNS